MIFRYGRNDFKTMQRGQEYSYLLTNGLGGFSSTTIINSVTRNDHSLFMACTKAPNHRKNIISKLEEILHIGDDKITLSSQEYVNYTKNKHGFNYLHSFTFEYLPRWTYFYDGVEIKKTIVYEYGKNTLGIRYIVNNNSNKKVKLELIPIFQFANIGEILSTPFNYKISNNTITANNITLNIYSNYAFKKEYSPSFENDYYYSYDSVDGRNSVGSGTMYLSYFYECGAKEKQCYEIIFSLEKEKPSSINTLIKNEISRQKTLLKNADYSNEIAKSLVRASDQFLCDRKSTNGKTIIAGYPWFTDWGRDTMFSVLGSCIATKRFDDAKNIFRTFISHLQKGLMPNLFPEGESKPLYNTVDASLLYIYAIYEYYCASKDTEFVKKEAFKPMLEIIEWYEKGTDFNIYMDDDYLINAGEGYDQVTWMDVNYENILPTARHGKPVEINAFWYNALKIVTFFGKEFNIDISKYKDISKKVKKSFEEKFWNEKENCLKDVISGNDYDYQVRSNQIWTIMLPFNPLSKEKSKLVVDKVYSELYTPYGLRTLSKYDRQFVKEYSGSHYKRDMSYHQGTVWPFPLGGFFIAYLKVNDYSTSAKEKVLEQLNCFEDALREGCVGQLPEIYDGLYPNESRGCFAQAWSVSEILRVFMELKK
ncbi:MAG: amylo-alpha-1,6-glucosidase [Vallitalea sp.]|jgi:predicted glycogen debranching enzyme|nr:amylo-alpha-1,6-glucosidase [Vallitalea sp.]